jgi:hypothetical protein
MKKPVPLATDEDAELDQLIAGGRLSGAEYDRVERRVLVRAEAKTELERAPTGAARRLRDALGALWRKLVG